MVRAPRRSPSTPNMGAASVPRNCTEPKAVSQSTEPVLTRTYQPRMSVSISNAQDVRRSAGHWNLKLRTRKAARVNGAFYPVLRSRSTAGSAGKKKARCDRATEQDQADVARGTARDARLAVGVPRLHGRGHGAPGLRRPLRRHAARADGHERRVADAAGHLADRHRPHRPGAVERPGHHHE